MTVSNVLHSDPYEKSYQSSESVELKENSENKHVFVSAKEIGTDYSYKHEIVWKNAIGFLIFHLLALWGLYIALTGGASWKTVCWTYFVVCIGQEGVTIGAHRYYTHRSFKAKPVLRAIFNIAQATAGQNSMFTWCRDHRLHHRYSDTDADPHNAKRGFFFSHIGWLMMKKHPHVINLGRKIDMSDLEADWMVMWQKKYYFYLYFLLSVFIPIWVPIHFFGESWLNSILGCYFVRSAFLLNGTWLVNSAAHLYGTRPYDKNLQPVETWFISFITWGEGWHNYHHAFPWDYKAAELPILFNQSAKIIKFFEKIGLAYDLKTAGAETVKNRILRAGDGTHPELGNAEARAAVTALGPLHPFNPSYNAKYEAPAVALQPSGLPLFHEKDVFDCSVDSEALNKTKSVS